MTSVTPDHGPTDGGTEVTILGVGFDSQTGVLFGELTARSVQCTNSGLICATTPAQPAGEVPIVLIDSSGSAIPTGFSFKYDSTEAPRPEPLAIASITPASGPVTGGTPVTIKGSGFGAGVGLLFGDVAPSTFTVVNQSLINAVTPAHAKGVVDVLVSGADGRTVTLPSAFTYLSPEEAGLYVSSISPLSGPIAGGTRLTMEGGGFVSGTAVFFGAAAALDITIVNEGLMTAKSPPNPPGQTTVRLRTPDGREIAFADPFTYFDKPGDSDGDGLSDEQELAGWSIAVDLYGFGADHPLALVYFTVFSDPDMPDTDLDGLSDYDEYLFGSNPDARDTDHDGLGDAEEIDRWWTSPVSVDTDGDADGPDGDLPPNPSLFDGAELKIDFENDPTHTPAIDATSPTLPDTDADARTDYEEFDHPVRSPILANLPEVEVGLEDAVDIRLNVEYAEEIGRSREYGRATTTSQTHTDSFSRSHMIGAEVGIKLGVEAEGSAGLFEWGKVKKKFEFSASVKTEHTFEYGTEDSVTNQQEYHEFQTDSRNYTEAYSSGSMSGGLRISNPGNIAYHLDNFGLTVRLWDRSFDPATGQYVGEFKTLATLTPALADGVTLAPGDSTPVLQISDDDVNPDVVKQFLAQPKTLHLETAYYDLETAEGLNFAFIEEETRALTATVVIDFGDGNLERYYIAARVNRNPDSTYTGVNLYNFLTQHLEIPIETTTEPLVPGLAPPPSNRLWRVRGMPVAPDPSIRAFWVVVGDNDEFFDSPSVGFTDIMLHGGDSVMLILTTDEDGDGLTAYEEELYGTSDEGADSDGDGLPDLLEARDQKQPDESVQEAGWMVRVKGQPAYRTYSDPSAADADGDGLSDLEERGGCEIDGALAIDVTDETACTDQNGYWHPFRGWGCVFCAEGVEGCADIDNQADCEANGGSWTPLGTDPNRKDTDDDGLPDDVDPHATLPAGRLHVKPDGGSGNDGLSWDNALSTIEEAIAEWNTRNNDGDEQNDVAEVWVAEGLYQLGATQTLYSGLSLYGGFDGTETKLGQRSSVFGTVIEPEHPQTTAYRAFNGHSVNNVSLDGLLISGWQWTQDNDHKHGGAVSLDTCSDITLSNMTFLDNRITPSPWDAATKGGALFALNTDNLIVENCFFSANGFGDLDANYKQAYGGALSCVGTSVTLRLSVFEGNDARFGGALDLYGGRLGADRSQFSGNGAHWATANDPGLGPEGGAIRADDVDEFALENCAFEHNAARNFTDEVDPHQWDCEGSACCVGDAHGCPARGGAVCVNADRISVTNCVFLANQTIGGTYYAEWDPHDGAAMYAETNGEIYVTNCTFTENTREGYVGHALEIWGDGYKQIVNVVSAWNGNESNVRIQDGNYHVASTCLHPIQNDGGVYDDGNIQDARPWAIIDADPGFVDCNDQNCFNVHLSDGSPLIDAGTNFVDIDPVTPGVQFLPEFDLDWNPRIVDGNGDGEATVDVGAYEYQGQ